MPRNKPLPSWDVQDARYVEVALSDLIVPHNNPEGFQAFFNLMAREVPTEGKDFWLVLNNDSWHKAKSLR